MALVLLAAVGDSYNFHLSLKTLIPVSVRVDRCLLKKKLRVLYGASQFWEPVCEMQCM